MTIYRVRRPSSKPTKTHSITVFHPADILYVPRAVNFLRVNDRWTDVMAKSQRRPASTSFNKVAICWSPDRLGAERSR